MKSVYEHFQREADIFDGEGYVPIKREIPPVRAWISKDIITGEMIGGTVAGCVPIHPSYWNWFADKLYTEIQVEVIGAKIFGTEKSDGTYYCDYCCNGDGCDDASHIARHKCPHCNGTGSLKSDKYIVPLGTRTKLEALNKNYDPNPNTNTMLRNARRRRDERKIVEDVVKEFDPQTREEWITMVIPSVIKQIKELNNADKGSN